MQTHTNHIDTRYLNGRIENDSKRSSYRAELERFCDRLNMAKGDETTYALAKRTGLNQSLLRKYLSGASMPLVDRANELANVLKVDLKWLVTGEGEMRSNSDIQPPQGRYPAQIYEKTASYEVVEPAQIEQSSEAVCDDTEGIIPVTMDDFALVPVYDVQASAGHGSHVESELRTGHLAFRRDWLRDKGLKIKDLAIITAKGDSMEPTISDGDIMLVDTSIDKIIDDTIYIVQTDHHLIVKRIQQALDGSLIIISDNQRYERQKISSEQAKNVKIAGRVKWYGHEI